MISHSFYCNFYSGHRFTGVISYFFKFCWLYTCNCPTVGQLGTWPDRLHQIGIKTHQRGPIRINFAQDIKNINYFAPANDLYSPANDLGCWDGILPPTTGIIKIRVVYEYYQTSEWVIHVQMASRTCLLSQCWKLPLDGVCDWVGIPYKAEI